MEYTYNNLNENETIFINKLKNYLNVPIYFFGSIQRIDYIPNLSDIDLLIFYDNKPSFLYKLLNFLNLNKNDCKKIFYKINDKLIYGYKIKYNQPIYSDSNNLKLEISLYHEKYKSFILNYEIQQIYLPFYITIPLLIIKYLYYLNLISKKIYLKSKKYIINFNKQNTQFITL